MNTAVGKFVIISTCLGLAACQPNKNTDAQLACEQTSQQVEKLNQDFQRLGGHYALQTIQSANSEPVDASIVQSIFSANNDFSSRYTQDPLINALTIRYRNSALTGRVGAYTEWFFEARQAINLANIGANCDWTSCAFISTSQQDICLLPSIVNLPGEPECYWQPLSYGDYSITILNNDESETLPEELGAREPLLNSHCPDTLVAFNEAKANVSILVDYLPISQILAAKSTNSK